MACSQITCVNFVLPLAGIENGLLAMLAASDDDVTGIVVIDDPKSGTKSPVEFEWIELKHAIEGSEVTTRGAFSTSVDAFLVAQTRSGSRGYLLEWWYTEDGGEKDMGKETREKRVGANTKSYMRLLRHFVAEFRLMPGSMNRSTKSCGRGS